MTSPAPGGGVPGRADAASAPPAPARQRLWVALVVLAVAAGALWAYRSGTSGVEAAPAAGAPECAALLDDLPASLGVLGRVPQGAAGVAVWEGPGGREVVLRCGAQVLGPTTKECVPVGPDPESSVDWVVDARSDRAVRFLTYGREPAVEVTVRFGDAGAAGASGATAQLVDLAGPVAAIRQTRTCL
ncbi:DUF3515 family protein [Kineococcus sp. SYSU DK004]|uniref:DUF3515 family protein n=1 Tax=Kineococcus sp. SYSU DK004 TaxID=3383125 RepID=UPI003D7C74CD